MTNTIIMSMESGKATILLDLPEKIFAASESPVGIMVNPYDKAGGISHILNAMEVDEIEVLRKSSFEKFIELAEKPTYFGRLGRFSLRKFAVVTSLPCGKFPKASKNMKNLISEKPYWHSFFGMLKEVSVSSVIRMLKRKTVTDKEIHIKYVCIAMLSFVILPTTHYPKISAGSLSFKMLITSIKETNKIRLSQNTIAFPGFLQALQLVMMEVVPALNEFVHQDCSLESEIDFGEKGDGCEENPSSNSGISPGHAMNLDASANCLEDNMFISRITRTMFVGGAAKADVFLMHEKAEIEALARKTKKRKVNTQHELSRVENKVDEIKRTMSVFQEVIMSHVARNTKEILECFSQIIAPLTYTVMFFLNPLAWQQLNKVNGSHREDPVSNASSLPTITEDSDNPTSKGCITGDSANTDVEADDTADNSDVSFCHLV
ncbi:hypothetical protein N665_0018s0015 [Sinapis alba]|nr:hypothetical protein N665_0018s0015 [Sinapis alba]